MGIIDVRGAWRIADRVHVLISQTQVDLTAEQYAIAAPAAEAHGAPRFAAGKYSRRNLNTAAWLGELLSQSRARLRDQAWPRRI